MCFYEVDRHIADLWSKGILFELFVKRILDRKLNVCTEHGPVVLSFPAIDSQSIGRDSYRKLTGWHEVDLLFVLNDKLLLVECKNTSAFPVVSGYQYNDIMHFLGISSDIERYYAIETQKVFIQTSPLHDQLYSFQERSDFASCTKDDVVNNLEPLRAQGCPEISLFVLVSGVAVMGEW